MKYLKINVLYVFMLFFSTGYAQSRDVEGLKEFQMYENGLLIRIDRYDESGKKTFWKDWQYSSRKNSQIEYPALVMTGLKEYDENGNTTRWISAHGNVGFSIYICEQKNDSTQIEYVIRDGYEKPAKKLSYWSYEFIGKVNMPKELLALKEIKDMLRQGTKRLAWERIYDKNNNLIRKRLYDKKAKISSDEEYVYNSKGQKIFMKYAFHSKLRTRHFQYNQADQLILQTETDLKSNSKEPFEYIAYEYDEQANLSQKITTTHGKTVEIEKHEYNTKGQLIKTLVWEDGKTEVSEEFRYKYEGDLLVKELRINHDLKREKPAYEAKIYEYKYLFY